MAPFNELIIYLRVAQAFKARLQMSDRDRALVMAKFCRQLILQNNQGHMLRNYPSFFDAIEDSDFGIYLKQVRRKLSPEQAESQILLLRHRCDVKPIDYKTKSEYAAAVMGVDSKWIKDHFG